ncbi:ATP-binding protein [Pajaroellobacter abortibovis]|uniref:Histidine kinase domain-containing protein n=1 Tax=Pajaroellobacter abortibovis TaxID=1882918 RepID=A0A1L6MYK5_9BACT|nr:ATP-binding protein [Pajaroellobacter abortibovis]APS00592.1 hypothetical protein BCY86_07840 [Pajaroellobacter abortibovis]
MEKQHVHFILDLQNKGIARFDKRQILRVIHNPSRNIADTIEPQGGDFTLTVAKEQGNLTLMFADAGSGISPKIEPRLFQSFVTNGKRGGIGLGLSIAQKNSRGTWREHPTLPFKIGCSL